MNQLPRKLLDVAYRVRVGETLHRDDELIDEAAHALAALEKRAVVYQATEPDGEPRWGDDAFSDCATAFPHSRPLYGA